MYRSLMVIFMDQRIHHLRHEQHGFFGWTPMVGWFAGPIVIWWLSIAFTVSLLCLLGGKSTMEALPSFQWSETQIFCRPLRLEWQGDALNEAILISNSESNLPSNLKMAGMTIGMWPVQTSSARLMSILLFSWPSMRRCIICDIHWCQWNSLVLSPRIGLAISNGMFGIPNFTMEAYELTEGICSEWRRKRANGDRLFRRLPKCYTATVPLWNRRVLSEDLS